MSTKSTKGVKPKAHGKKLTLKKQTLKDLAVRDKQAAGLRGGRVVRSYDAGCDTASGCGS